MGIRVEEIPKIQDLSVGKGPFFWNIEITMEGEIDWISTSSMEYKKLCFLNSFGTVSWCYVTDEGKQPPMFFVHVINGGVGCIGNNMNKLSEAKDIAISVFKRWKKEGLPDTVPRYCPMFYQSEISG